MPQDSDLLNSLRSAADAFDALRPRLFGLAYRILGSAADAEDIVQEVWLRWSSTDRGAVRDASAFLRLITTRLAINVCQSARARRESYVGQWLPEPVDTTHDPALGAEHSEPLELGLLRLMERLTPAERAAYVLHEAFDYPFAQVAEVLEVTEANARQLASRARRHLTSHRRRRVSAAEHRELLGAFVAAARAGDIASLERMLAPDAVSYSDGGGIVRAARLPIVGRTRVSTMVARISSWFWNDVDVKRVEVNGLPALLLSRAGAGPTLVVLHASARGIDEVLWFLNPRKLEGVSARFSVDGHEGPSQPRLPFSTDH